MHSKWNWKCSSPTLVKLFLPTYILWRDTSHYIVALGAFLCNMWQGKQMNAHTNVPVAKQRNYFYFVKRAWMNYHLRALILHNRRFAFQLKIVMQWQTFQKLTSAFAHYSSLKQRKTRRCNCWKNCGGIVCWSLFGGKQNGYKSWRDVIVLTAVITAKS